MRAFFICKSDMQVFRAHLHDSIHPINIKKRWGHFCRTPPSPLCLSSTRTPSGLANHSGIFLHAMKFEYQDFMRVFVFSNKSAYTCICPNKSATFCAYPAYARAFAHRSGNLLLSVLLRRLSGMLEKNGIIRPYYSLIPWVNSRTRKN